MTLREAWSDHQRICPSPGAAFHYLGFYAGWNARQLEIDQLQSEARTARRFMACLTKQLGGAVLVEDVTLANLPQTAELRVERCWTNPGTVISLIEPPIA